MFPTMPFGILFPLRTPPFAGVPVLTPQCFEREYQVGVCIIFNVMNIDIGVYLFRVWKLLELE
jgi:hypothetical protein